ncbi:MAG: hypothetical protein CMH63_02180 [Nanoarchaeota archaeon]|jgi:intein/homing endonuclease|nr:hypothetical protein [Nanoarchaeota archaeon]|tara:strand:- start:9109 stop:9819 length:711 start_codon:yes stop_codon:yes gene_type:complete
MKTGDLAEIMGIHIGDGCISENERYSEYYLGGDLKEEKLYHDGWVAPLFNRIVMLPLFNKKVEYKEHPKVGVYGFYIFNKELVDFFKRQGAPSGSKLKVTIPFWILKNEDYSKRFLRGLFDTDGTIYFDKNRSCKNPINNRPDIKLASVSEKLIKQVYDILKKFGLNPMMKKPYKGKKDKNRVYAVRIYRKLDIEYFIKEIEFKNPKHYTKWLVFKKVGYCLPKTTLNQRLDFLEK